MMKIYLALALWMIISEHELMSGAELICKRRINAEYRASVLMSPGYPFAYPNNMRCEWVIQAPEGQQVEIIFLEILTESCCDTIELRDGNTSSAGLLARYRGNVSESVYVSTFGSLYIKFTTDDSFVFNGFMAQFRTATTKTQNCTVKLDASDEPQLLTSPGWPYGYENNLLCTWTITAPEGRVVSITFVEFETESCCDYVLVRHGKSMRSPMYELGGLLRRPFTDVSTGPIIQVIFRSDSSLSTSGFKLQYKAVKRTKTDLMEIPKKDKCTGKIEIPEAGHGTLTTPGYPEKHENNMNCVWVLVAPPGMRVSLWFTSISTEACCDFIKIRDGETPTSKKLGILSGHSTKFAHYKSSGNVMRVDFQSDVTKVYSGFRAVYEVLKDSSEEKCGGDLRAAINKRQYISSPNWPNNARSLYCAWNITADEGYSVLFKIIGFHTFRRRDSIQFFDGESAIPFASLRQNTQHDDESFYSQSSNMYVIFRPDVTTVQGGFRGYFVAVPKRQRNTTPSILVSNLLGQHGRDNR